MKRCDRVSSISRSLWSLNQSGGGGIRNTCQGGRYRKMKTLVEFLLDPTNGHTDISNHPVKNPPEIGHWYK